ncbi:MAG TPA: site-specific integrase [Anaerolineae bacterium]|nr:site-specific integrase [Anaerolineae bacterium]
MQITSVTELLEQYFLRRMLADKSRQNYEMVVRVFTRDVADNIDELDEETLLAWRDSVLKRATGITFNNYLRHLRAIFNYGLKRQWVDSNPFSIIEPAPRQSRKPKTLTSSQYNKAIAFVEKSGTSHPSWFWVAVIEFIATTGARGRQVVELQWRDIDFDRATIRFRTEGSKTQREWFIPLPDSIGETLYQWYFSMGVYKNPALLRTQVFNVTLHSKRFFGREMTINQLNDFFSRLSRNIGFSIGCRRLRHTLATRLANSTSNSEGYLFALRDLLGHTDIRTTQIYVGGNVERIRKMMNDSGICSSYSKRVKFYGVDMRQ